MLSATNMAREGADIERWARQGDEDWVHPVFQQLGSHRANPEKHGRFLGLTCDSAGER